MSFNPPGRAISRIGRAFELGLPASGLIPRDVQQPHGHNELLELPDKIWAVVYVVRAPILSQASGAVRWFGPPLRL